MEILVNSKGVETKVYARTIEEGCRVQLMRLIETDAYANEKVRIMPDCHAGKGSVIGFTSTYSDKVIPNTVGVDISCGMLVVKLGKLEVDLPEFDNMVKLKIPSGMEVREGRYCEFKRLEELFCYRDLKDAKRVIRSIGTLGGGNHFIELDKNDAGEVYLVIHTGSRNLGKQVCEFYQQKAIQLSRGLGDYLLEREKIIADYKQRGKRGEIEQALRDLKRQYRVTKTPTIEEEQAWVEGVWLERYIADCKICAEFAHLNRESIAEILISKYFKGLHLCDFEHFETLHNYIDFEHRMIRKGAVSALKGEQLIIPMNMRDGSLICIGKGNEDWNLSAPHGAGRVMSRAEAFKKLDMGEFKDSMQGIYTTTVNKLTLDESPMVYKPMEEIMEVVTDTVNVVDVIKPIYNFKAAEDARFWRKKKE